MIEINHQDVIDENNKADDVKWNKAHAISGSIDRVDLGDVFPIEETDLGFTLPSGGGGVSGLISGTIKVPYLIEAKTLLPPTGSNVPPYSVNYGDVSIAVDPVNNVNSLLLPAINPGALNAENVLYKDIFGATGSWEITCYCDTNGYTYFWYVFLAQSGFTNAGNWGVPTGGYAIKIHSQNVSPVIALVRLDGSIGTQIISYSISSTQGTFDIKVTRDSNGNFELFVGGVSVGTAQDTTYTSFTTEYLISSFMCNTYLDTLKYNDTVIPIGGDSIPPYYSVVFNNLNGDVDLEYFLDYDIFVTATGQDGQPYILLNGATNNYECNVQRWWNGTGDQANFVDKLAFSRHLSSGSSGYETGRCILKVKSGNVRTFNGEAVSYDASETQSGVAGGVWNNITDNITSLTFGRFLSNFYGSVKLYKMVELVLE